MAATLMSIDETRLETSLREAARKLERADGETVLDFSLVQRLDPGALRALEELAAAAEGRPAKIILSGVKVDVYKVLKLVKLSEHFSFLS
jgi:anti-anti-sigma regulatory factor